MSAVVIIQIIKLKTKICFINSDFKFNSIYQVIKITGKKKKKKNSLQCNMNSH